MHERAYLYCVHKLPTAEAERRRGGGQRMTIRGSLGDVEVVELLQMLAAGRKSGELVVAGADEVARFFLDEGRLCHAESGTVVGQEVLVEVVGWDEGEFEFRPKLVPETRSLNSDVFRALMLALKTRDERRAGRSKEDLPCAPEQEQGVLIHERLAELVAANPAIQYACLLKHQGGRVVPCAASSQMLPAALDDLADAVFAILSRHPRQPVYRVLVEDAAGAVVVAPLACDATLVVLAGPDAPLGAVTLNVRRLALSLGELEAQQPNLK